jgi:two-component system, NarL family, invasion response regulator UvrY
MPIKYVRLCRGFRGVAMRILIADDHEVIRKGVIRVLQAHNETAELLEAANGKEAVEKAIEWKPNLILLDVRLPLLSGFEVAKEIRQRDPLIRILFFSIHDGSEILEQAMLEGDGFVLKDKIVELLPSAIHALSRRQRFFPSISQADFEDEEPGIQ